MTEIWFIWLVMLGAGGFLLGKRLGRDDRMALVTLITSTGLIGTWAWLSHHPASMVQVIPLWMLTHIEGVGAVPIYMVVTGVAWSKATKPSQKRLTVMAAFFGAIFFLQGSMWMLQPNAAAALSARRVGPYVKQTQEFSCVAAACATVLHHLDIRTSEAEMAAMTETRPGSGSTLIRAMAGLTDRLAGSRYTPALVEATVDELRSLPTPMLTPLSFDSGQLHMVVVVTIGDTWVWAVDPMVGPVGYRRHEFEEVYLNRAIYFIRH